MRDPLARDLAHMQQPSHARQERHERAVTAKLVDAAPDEHPLAIDLRNTLPRLGLEREQRYDRPASLLPAAQADAETTDSHERRDRDGGRTG